MSSLLASGRPDDLIVCYEHGRPVRWEEFTRRVGAFLREIDGREGRRWLLDCAGPLDFVAALLAVLHTGGRAVVAPGLQPGMKEQLRAAYDAVLSEAPYAALSGHDWRVLDARKAGIDLFTSGSSGEPKRVEKSLAQLETEAAVLESCWGASLGDAAVVATVPHHHIYGILF